LLDDQRRYGLRIPFEHEGRTVTGQLPKTMENARTGGTLWFFTIDAAGVVTEDGFAIDADQLIATALKVGAAA